MKKVLIIGGSGLLGRGIARHRIYDIRPLAQLGFPSSLPLHAALQETLNPWL